MAEQIVYITARGEEPLAIPTDIAKQLLVRSPAVLTVGKPDWHERALTMAVTVEATSIESALGIVQGALASGTTSVWSQFAVSAKPLIHTPALL